MKKTLLALSLIFAALPASATETFRYLQKCYLDGENGQVFEDVCTVIDVRNSSGALYSRGVFSNKFSLTVKNKWDAKSQKFLTWDSHNKFEYHYEYKVGKFGSYVMPGFSVENIPWD